MELNQLVVIYNYFLLFCSTTRRHEISSEYFLKPRSLYCCYRSIFEARKVENVFSNILSLVILSPHGFTLELILNIAKLYLLIDLNPIIINVSNYNEFLRE